LTRLTVKVDIKSIKVDKSGAG